MLCSPRMDKPPGNETAPASGGRTLVGRSGRRWTLAGVPVVDGPWHFYLAEDSLGRPVGVRFGPPDRVAAEMGIWAGLVESGECQAQDIDFGTADGQVFLVHPRPSHVRFVVGRVVYRLAAEPIASGGQAAVYRATSPTGEVVAIKMAWPDQRGARLGQERDTLEQIHREDPKAHRWIVTVADSGIAPDGRRFLAISPWMDDTLLNWAWRRPPLPRLLHALEKSADALHDFHQAPDHRQVRVHRDIKPENLLIRELGDRLEVLLGDLGGARAEKMLEQGSTLAVWTPKYAPPEQRLLLSRALDEDFQSMDIYALGVTMFYVITWRYPDAAREDLLNERGQELNELYLRKATGLSPEEDQRYESLRREDPENFLDLRSASLWSAQDDERLRRAFRERCRDEAAAVRAADAVADALKKAIRVDYRTRMKKVSNLAAALQRAREIVEAAGAPPAAAEVPEPMAPKLAVKAEAARPPPPPAVRRAQAEAQAEAAPVLARPRPAPGVVGQRADAPRKAPPPSPVEVRPAAEPPGAGAPRTPGADARAPAVMRVEPTRPVRPQDGSPAEAAPGPRVAAPERTAAPRVEARVSPVRALESPANEVRARGQERSDPRQARPPVPEHRSGGSDPSLKPLPIRVGGGVVPEESDVNAEPTSESVPLTLDPHPDLTSPGGPAAAVVSAGTLRKAGRQPAPRLPTLEPVPQDSLPLLGEPSLSRDNLDEERPTTLDRTPPRRDASSLPPDPSRREPSSGLRSAPALPPPKLATPNPPAPNSLAPTPPAPLPRQARPAVDPEATVLLRMGGAPPPARSRDDQLSAPDSGSRSLAMVALAVAAVTGMALLCALGAVALWPETTGIASTSATIPATPAVVTEVPTIADPKATASGTSSAPAPAPAPAPVVSAPAGPTTVKATTGSSASEASSSTTRALTPPASPPTATAPTTPAQAVPTETAASPPKPATSTPPKSSASTPPKTTTKSTPEPDPDLKEVTILCCAGGEVLTMGGKSMSCPARFSMAPSAQPVEWRLSGGARKTLTVDPNLGTKLCAADNGSGLKVHYGRDACLSACE